jgi:hypothetical protein
MSSNPYQAPEKLIEIQPGNLPSGFLVVKNIGVLSVAKMMGCLYAAIGLIIGGIISLISLVGAVAGPGANAFPAVFGVLSIILIPLVYGIMGFIAGIIIAALYNVIAAVAGGIEMQVAHR